MAKTKSNTKTKSKTKKPKESKKEAREKGIIQARNEIGKTHSSKYQLKKKIHQSNLYVGKVEKIVSPDTKMTKARKLVRHLATTLLAQDPDMVEVQVGIDHAKKSIYIASNKKQSELAAMLIPKNQKNQKNPTLNDLQIPDPNQYAGRVKRHMEKLSDFIKTDKGKSFSDYTIEQVLGLNEQHAETKIVDEKGNKLDYIGGTRRPCTACFVYLQVKKLNTGAYNPHHGAFWDSNAALLSLASQAIYGNISKTTLSKYHYVNQGAKGQDIYDYDTNSE